MELHAYLRIKAEYDAFYRDLLHQGKVPMKDTGIGFWSISTADDLFELFKKIKLDNHASFIDIGSGDGKAVLIASLFTRSHGIEYDPELHITASKIKDKLSEALKHDAMLHNDDYMKHDLSVYDVVFLHPDSRLGALEPKLLAELKGDLIVYGAEYHPVSLELVKTFNAHTTPVSIYRNPAGKKKG